jgi:DNA-binding NarL/FixJ family response regulator
VPSIASVLLVDDNERFLRLAAGALARRHPSRLTVVGAARNSAEAIAMVEELRPDVVLLDLRLGAESGLELIGPLRRAGAPIVVILTMHDPASYEHAALAAGASGFVTKARMTPDLWPIVERALEGLSPCTPQEGDS